MLAATGAVAFVLGVTVHSDHDNLAMTLVGVGALLVVIAVLLPRLQTLSGKVGGVEWTVGLTPPPTVTDDRNIAAARPDGLPQADLRSAGAPPSGSAGFAEAIKGGRAEVLVINLENGKAWLTSRLFVFVFVLMDLRGLQAVIFTHRPNDVDEVLGVAPAHDVIHGLASAYPWLPGALGTAWDLQRRGTSGPPTDRRLSIGDADNLYTFYVNQVSAPGAPVPAQLGEWIQRQDQMWERAAWIDPALVRRLLLASLFEQTVPESATPASTPNRETPESAALAYRGVRFVPVVNDRREYRSVVDRYAVLDTLWHRRAL
jgi:hypothetical protein